MSSVLITVVALFFAGMGVFALAAPQALVAPFRISLQGGEGRAEVRAVYGGFGVAIAGLLTFAAIEPSRATGIVVTVAAAVLGMAFGRLVSRVFDRPAAFYPIWFYFWVEILAGAILLTAVALP
ncbi:hypothetical protein JOF56_003113 [Kibdelosporangium banguiense]|uniref:DUF4345 domain-containing protein n=1 Tax=Kibdelosporangium banguiense TaxID=1365924 RepID=A0ABS4TE78_9PSEU|nr:DUF4345 family protein [Kibdelosporangium banguiense]MBP2322728.1 hypothetical protein [Kibdelosporangium banguiense]